MKPTGPISYKVLKVFGEVTGIILHPVAPNRHPELGSGSISRLYPSVYVARWMLKRVQHDVGWKRASATSAPLR
jgi:hypothetical protein